MSQSRVIPWTQLFPVSHRPGDVQQSPQGALPARLPWPGYPAMSIPVLPSSTATQIRSQSSPPCLPPSRVPSLSQESPTATVRTRVKLPTAPACTPCTASVTAAAERRMSMVGIGTSDVNLDKYRHTFCSLLGKDEDSWGLSYTGLLHHKGDKTNFSSRFGQGSIIGVHLDTWHGTLTFFKNRKCIGVAATKLQNKKFYPMVCSTAAKSSMKVIRSCASRTSLQYLCCFRLRQLLPDYVDTLEVLPLPPGLKQVLHNKLGWVLSMNYSTSKPSSSSSSGSDSDSSCGSDAEACQRKRCRRT
uniref:SplA/ryanodine receptor domain and SOCS box containing 3 n=1 Tax=Zonotrichia albicollis TaxID=44394 RepID=A0A8D2QAH3_ZONAL